MAQISTTPRLRPPSAAEKLLFFALAFGVLAILVALAFALGWLFGRIVL
ncbi:MAG TPA: hypothetical protein VHD91_07830 [Gaiellaceae bacterium]|nr:hypothetical protein [Gaiellaceae bacterium]